MSLVGVVDTTITDGIGKVSLQVIILSAFEKGVVTMVPAADIVLGVLLPAAFPVTASTLPSDTTEVLAITSNRLIPGTAVIDPADDKRVLEGPTVFRTPSAGGFTPTVGETGPVVEDGCSAFQDASCGCCSCPVVSYV